MKPRVSYSRTLPSVQPSESLASNDSPAATPSVSPAKEPSSEPSNLLSMNRPSVAEAQ
jgi:hypothetical protein